MYIIHSYYYYYCYYYYYYCYYYYYYCYYYIRGVYQKSLSIKETIQEYQDSQEDMGVTGFLSVDVDLKNITATREDEDELKKSMILIPKDKDRKVNRNTLVHVHYIVQDDLLAGVIFGGFAYGKKLADFILAILYHVPLSMLRLKQNGRFYIGDFFIETPITNINSLPINHIVWYTLLLKLKKMAAVLNALNFVLYDYLHFFLLIVFDRNLKLADKRSRTSCSRNTSRN